MDVASKAGVSYATVSRVANNDPHVKAETRARVQQVMERLGYVVNRQARSLAGGRSHVIGVLVPDLGTGYIGEIMRGIDAELDLAHYDLMLHTTHRRAAKEAHYVSTLTQGMADGLLIVLPSNPADFMQTLRQHNFPYVLIDHQGTNEQDCAVGATNWQGAYNATEYLIKLGHQRIGFITGSMDLGCARDRLAGYQAALRTHHLPFDPEAGLRRRLSPARWLCRCQSAAGEPGSPHGHFYLERRHGDERHGGSARACPARSGGCVSSRV